MKVFIGIMAGLIVFSLVLGLAGFVVIGFNFNNMNFASDSDFEKKEFTSSGDFVKIKSELVFNSIKIERTEGTNFEVSYPVSEKYSENTKIQISENDGVLLIKDTAAKSNWFGFLGFHGLWTLSEETLRVTIIIPQVFEGDLVLQTTNGIVKGDSIGDFKQVSINTTNSEIQLSYFNAASVSIDTTNGMIRVSNLVCQKTLLADTTNGRIEIGFCVADKGDFDTTNGKITISDSCIKTIEADTTNGEIVITRVEADNVSTDTTNGDISVYGLTAKSLKSDTTNSKIIFENVIADIIKADTTNGSIKITVLGDKNDYTVSLKTTNGKVKLDGYDFGKRANTGNGGKSLSAGSTNGNITVNFM